MSREAEQAKAEVERYLNEREDNVTPRALSTLRVYTVDVRLREFRKARFPNPIESVPFDSTKGKRLMPAMAKALK